MNDTEKVDKLVGLLERLNAGEAPEAVKDEAREFLSEIGPEDLSLAEQKLVESGLNAGDLHQLCEVHMEMLGDEVEEMKAELPPGHVVHTLVEEHDHILGFLDELEELNETIQDMEKYDPDRAEWERLQHIAQHLVDTEPHHEREEEVLFPELEKRGVTGPPNIMRLEHDQLRPQKKLLKELADEVSDMDFNMFKRKVDAVVEFVVPTLRDHIFKENNILYPTAVRLIEDDSLWEKMKHDADEVGYCCFTPEA